MLSKLDGTHSESVLSMIARESRTMTFVVTKGGKPVAYTKDEDTAERWLLRHQPMSNDWAKTHEGYEVRPWVAPTDRDVATHHLATSPAGTVACVYCGMPRWQLVAAIGDENVTGYPCPKGPA